MYVYTSGYLAFALFIRVESSIKACSGSEGKVMTCSHELGASSKFTSFLLMSCARDTVPTGGRMKGPGRRRPTF